MNGGRIKETFILAKIHAVLFPKTVLPQSLLCLRHIEVQCFIDKNMR